MDSFSGLVRMVRLTEKKAPVSLAQCKQGLKLGFKASYNTACNIGACSTSKRCAYFSKHHSNLNTVSSLAKAGGGTCRGVSWKLKIVSVFS